MRLFRKNKAAAAREPAITAVSVRSNESAALNPPSPPSLAQTPLPALQLDLDLPTLTQSTLGFSSSIVAEDRTGSQMLPESAELQQHQRTEQAQQGPIGAGNYDVHPVVPPTNPAIGNVQPGGERSSILCGSYDFDLSMIHLIGNSSTSSQQDPSSQVQDQLIEQFGLGNLSLSSGAAGCSRGAIASNANPNSYSVSGPASQRQQSMVAPSANVSFSASKAIELAQETQKLYHIHQASRLGERADIRVVESRSSRDESSGSSEDGHTPALKGTLAAVADGKKLTDRALHIQKMREATAMGKVVAYNKLAHFQPHFINGAANEDDEDEDTMPLGGLKQAAARTGHADGSNAKAGVQQQHKPAAGNTSSNGQTVPSALPQDSVASIARQYMAMPAQMPMQMQMQMQMQAQASAPIGTHQGLNQGLNQAQPWQQRHMSGLSSPNASTLSLNQHQQQFQQPQQMHMMYSPCSPTVTGMHFANNAGAARAAMSDNGIGNMASTSIAYGNIGLARAPMLPDASKHHAYTPSPLGQPPVTAAGAAASIMPVDMRMAQYPSSMIGQVSMPSMNGSGYSQKMQPQQHQQQQQQQSMLTTFIPTQGACRGSLSKNPLMRDINKIKEFSVKDYTTRPTLLAEADSRRLAKKNMPGLGGTTCHSFQPQLQLQSSLPPPAQQPYQFQSPQQQPQVAQRGHSSYRNGDHDHAEHLEHARGGRKSDMSRRRPSPRMNHYDEDSYEDMSLSSGRSNGRYRGGPRDGSRNPKMQGRHSNHHQRSSNHRRNRYDRSGSLYNSDYEEHPSGREFRKVNPPPSSCNRRITDRRRRDYHHEDRHCDYYDYDELSDDYFSDELDDCSDGGYSERFDSSAGAGGRLRRRSAQRRMHVDDRMSRDRDYDREAAWKPSRSNGKGGMHRGGRSRPVIPVNLDDPRDNNDVLPRPAHRSRRGSVSDDSDLSDHAKSAKPRSQFGRILANITRQAAPGSPAAESKAESKDSEKAEPLSGNKSSKEGTNDENIDHIDEQVSIEASVEVQPEMHSAATTPVTAPVAVA